MTLHSTPVTATTNSHGIATFTNVAPGVHHVEYSANKTVYSEPVYVTSNFVTDGTTQFAPSQNAAVVLTSYHQPTGIQKSTVILVLVGALIIGYTALLPRLYGYFKIPSKQPSMVKAAHFSRIKSPYTTTRQFLKCRLVSSWIFSDRAASKHQKIPVPVAHPMRDSSNLLFWPLLLRWSVPVHRQRSASG